jgi:hypothetical protein
LEPICKFGVFAAFGADLYFLGRSDRIEHRPGEAMPKLKGKISPATMFCDDEPSALIPM